MLKQTWFESWFDTDYYHKLYYNRDWKEAAMFVDNLLQYLNAPPKSKCLDVACGKGRHALQICEAGHEVIGIDLSKNSIDEANELATDDLQFYVHDMRQTFYINYFDYVFNFFTSFGYFENKRENLEALQTMGMSLKKGGILVIDYLNDLYTINNFKNGGEKIIDDVHYKIEKHYDDNFFYKTIAITDPTIENKLVFNEKVARISFETFEKMMQEKGLKIINCFGDYKLSKFDKQTSPRIIIEAKKI